MRNRTRVRHQRIEMCSALAPTYECEVLAAHKFRGISVQICPDMLITLQDSYVAFFEGVMAQSRDPSTAARGAPRCSYPSRFWPMSAVTALKRRSNHPSIRLHRQDAAVPKLEMQLRRTNVTRMPPCTLRALPDFHQVDVCDHSGTISLCLQELQGFAPHERVRASGTSLQRSQHLVAYSFRPSRVPS
jgi:hypothetical protein